MIKNSLFVLVNFFLLIFSLAFGDSIQQIQSSDAVQILAEQIPQNTQIPQNSPPDNSILNVQPLKGEAFRCRNPHVTQCASKRLKILPNEAILKKYPISTTWVYSNYSISDRAKLLSQTANFTVPLRSFYLAVLAMIKDDALILPEWLEHHFAHGVEHFFLIDDSSADNSREVLAPYIAKGMVTLFDPPFQGQTFRQAAALKNSLIKILAYYKVEWVASLDIDEYLYSPFEFDIRKVLKEHELLASVGVSWQWFGSSGNVAQPASIVQSLTKRANLSNIKTFRTISEAYKILKHASQKYIVNTSFKIHNIDVHYVDVEGTEANLSDRLNGNSSFLIINHYGVQSKVYYEKALLKTTEHHKFHEKIRPNRDFSIVDINEIEDNKLAAQNIANKVPLTRSV
jgi:hypothetical protein